MAQQKVTKDKLVALILDEWSASYSDNGAIWEKAWRALLEAKEHFTAEELHQAIERARKEWPQQ